MRNKIIFIEQYDNRIIFMSGYYSEPYTMFFEELSDDESDVVKSKEMELGSKEYIVKTELGKTYRVSVRSKDTNEEVESQVFYLGNLTRKETIDQIIKTYDINKENILVEYNRLLYNLDNLSWVDTINYLINAYKEADKDTKKDFYFFIQGLIERYNYFSVMNNGEHVTLDNYFGTISFLDSTDSAMFYVRSLGRENTINNIYISEIQKIKTLQEKLCEVYLRKNGLTISKLFYFEPNDVFKKEIREQLVKIKERKENAMENNLTVPSVYVDLTEEEKSLYQLEQSTYPRNVFVKLPEVYADYPNIKFEFGRIKCLDFIEASPFKYYLTINEIDILHDPRVNRRIEIDPSDEFLFVNIRDYGIRNEGYFFFIEDENGTIVSDIHVFKRNDRSIESYTDYLLKKKEMSVLDYKKKTNALLTALKADDVAKSFIRKLIDKIENNDALSLLDVFSSEINNISNKHDNLFQILNIMLVNQTMQSQYSKDICTELKYKAYARTIALSAKKENTLFLVTQIGAQKSNFFEEIYIYNSSKTAVDFTISRDTRYFFVRAIDLDTGEISGFILLNFPDQTSTYYAKEYLISLSEVKPLGGNYSS